MQTEILSSKGLTREFKVIVSAQDIAEQKIAYIKSRAGKIKIDGFRPGKAPMPVLEQRLGGDALNHALRTFIDNSIKATAKEHNLQYINEPKVDLGDFEEGKDLSFSLTFEVMPEIKNTDFSKIKLDQLVVDMSDEEVEKAVKDLHKNHKSFEHKEGRAAEKGDRIACELSLSLNGKKVSGYQNASVTLDIGDKAFMLSGVDDAATGLKEGEKKTFSSTVADNFGDAQLAGKNVEVTLVVKKVSAPKKLKIDDEFAKEFKQETLEDLKKNLKENLQSNYSSIARLYLKRHLLDALEKAYDFPLPESMVTSEFNNIWQHLQNELAQAKARGEKIEDEDKPEDELKTEYQKIAERRVRLGLIISHVAKEEKITLSQDELRNAIYREAMRYTGQERKVMEYYRSHPHMIDRLVAPILEDKVVDFIATKIKTTEVKVDVPGLKKKVKGVVPTFFDNEDAA